MFFRFASCAGVSLCKFSGFDGNNKSIEHEQIPQLKPEMSRGTPCCPDSWPKNSETLEIPRVFSFRGQAMQIFARRKTSSCGSLSFFVAAAYAPIADAASFRVSFIKCNS